MLVVGMSEYFVMFVGRYTMPGQCEEKLVDRQAIVHLAILIGIALVIGVYLIITTVLISRDGVFYIERAQQFTADPVAIIKAHSPGYPFLIMAAHKCASLFTDDTSVFTWIYSAQSVTLLCRLLALIPLYFIGKLLVGSKNSFLALLILIFLPYPTKVACDVVREWPYILFLSTGFLLLLLGANNKKWWTYGLLVMIACMGFIVRKECLQLIFYAMLWQVLNMFVAKSKYSKKKTILLLLVLLVSFLLPFIVNVKCYDKIVTSEYNSVIKKSTLETSGNFDESCSEVIVNYYAIGSFLRTLPDVFGEIVKSISEILLYFFVPALFVGANFYLREAAKSKEKLFMLMFIFTNLGVSIYQYYHGNHHISQRWILPMIVIVIFYVPKGLQVLAGWIESEFPTHFKENINSAFSMFNILLVIGLCVCLPKLLRPIRADKEYIFTAASWLRDNTAKEDWVDAFDGRVCMYAERTRWVKWSQKARPTFAVRMLKEEQIDEFELPENWSEVETVVSNAGEEKRILKFYKIKWWYLQGKS